MLRLLRPDRTDGPLVPPPHPISFVSTPYIGPVIIIVIIRTHVEGFIAAVEAEAVAFQEHGDERDVGRVHGLELETFLTALEVSTLDQLLDRFNDLLHAGRGGFGGTRGDGPGWGRGGREGGGRETGAGSEGEGRALRVGSGREKGRNTSRDREMGTML